MSDKLKVTPEQAAPVLGLSPGTIREYMRRGELPIGHVRKVREYRRKTGINTSVTKCSYRYDIYKNLVLAYVGLTEWPE